MSLDVISQPLVQIARELRSGELSPETYLERLEANFEEKEPDILAFLPEKDRFARLISEAADLVASYQDPLSRPPLFCVPIGIKDIFHVDQFDTKAGSKLPVSVLRGREALSVRMLKEAGALIMGKTVTTEFAYFAPGPTRNPHNLEHTPGGSSSGSAAAVAARLCPVTTGTQTIGSVIRPASYCGITGFKPSYDRVSRSGIVPLSPSLDHFGLFTNEISGIDLVANVLRPDWQIAVAERLPVLGIPEGPYLAHTSAEGLGFFRDTCDRLTKSGYELISIDILADFEEISARHQKILAAETAQVHADWYPEFGHLYDKRTRELIEEGFSITVGELAEALTGRQRLRRTLMAQMDGFGVDLWIAPSAVGPADHGLASTGDPIMNLPWTHAGLPVVSLPASISEAGLPLGLQIAGRWYGDEVLLEWGADLERVLVKTR
jgi:Asp-tRNA(Asn)/Glu-tRNA(Gln) amidotransferase A subunit family amidase